MDNFWKSFLASLLAFVVAGGALFILGIIVVIALISSAVSSIGNTDSVVYKPRANTILVMDFKTPIVESVPDNPLYDVLDIASLKMPSGGYSAHDVTNAIRRASQDVSIEGIFLDLSYGIMPDLANLEEIRSAIEQFRKSGKKVYAYSDIYTHNTYYLASVADEIHMNPVGDFMWNGLSSVTPYYKNLIDKLDIDIEVFKYGKYKSAVEPYLLSEMSKESRMQSEVLLNNIWNGMLGKISKDRDVSVKELNDIANNLSVSTALEAKKVGFIDEITYLQDLSDILSNEKRYKRVMFDTYLAASKEVQNATKYKDNVEVIYVDGVIMSGDSDGPGIVGDRTIVRKIERAAKSKSVKAIVLRVNSPGGSALASNVINKAIIDAKKNKPVIVSMGSSAASGGYYVACSADAIVASPYTLTGSIGVFGIGASAERFIEDKIGVNFNAVKTNKHSDMGLMHRKLTQRERMHMQKSVDSVYVKFVNCVAYGRDMSFDEVDKVAEGRVWSTGGAIDAGLVDKIGGLHETVFYAAELADLGNDFGIVVRRSKQNDLFSTLLSMPGGSVLSFIESRVLGSGKLSKSLQSEISILERMINGDRVQAISTLKLNPI